MHVQDSNEAFSFVCSLKCFVKQCGIHDQTWSPICHILYRYGQLLRPQLPTYNENITTIKNNRCKCAWTLVPRWLRYFCIMHTKPTSHKHTRIVCLEQGEDQALTVFNAFNVTISILLQVEVMKIGTMRNIQDWSKVCMWIGKLK